MNIIDKIKMMRYIDFEALVEGTNMKYYLIWSGRKRGKSTNALNYVIKKSYVNMQLFTVLFRNERRVSKVSQYFNHEYNINYLKKISGGEYDHFMLRSGIVYFASYNKKGKDVAGPIAGYYEFLITQSEVKSAQYDNVYNIIYEEFVTDSVYLVDEVYKFESFLSTVLRDRENDPDSHVFLLGNTLSRVNPYIGEWELFEVLEFQPGDWKIYTVKSEVIEFQVLCLMLIDMDDDGIAMSKKGKEIQKGQWEEHKSKLLTTNYKDYNCRYEFSYIYSGFYFDIRLLTTSNNDYFLFCSKRTTQIKDEKRRIIGDYDSMSKYYTRDFTPIFSNEAFIFNLIKLDKIYFSDVKTGTNFYHCLRQMRVDYKLI